MIVSRLKQIRVLIARVLRILRVLRVLNDSGKAQVLGRIFFVYLDSNQERKQRKMHVSYDNPVESSG